MTNIGKEWTEQQDLHLTQMFMSGRSIEKLAQDLGRTPEGIHARLERLCLVEPGTITKAREAMLKALS